MNIAIIDIGWAPINSKSLNNTAVGGSETWLLQISKEFSKSNHVEIFCNTNEEENVGNIKFIPLKGIITYILENNVKYDFIILNRLVDRFNLNFIGLIKKHELTKNVYIQIHDLSILHRDAILLQDITQQLLLHDPIVKGIITLNEWHRNNLLLQYPSLDQNKVYCAPNGVDLKLFPSAKVKKDNRVIWSSCAERGLDILINDIYPIVKQQVPDFGIDVAGYNNLNEVNNLIGDKDVKILGHLNKTDLYKEMHKHKCWFYPGTFAETFCITMLENIICGAIPVSPFTYGTRPVISNELANKYWPVGQHINFLEKGSESYATAVQFAANAMISILKGEKVNNEDIMKRAKIFTWDNPARIYMDLYKQHSAEPEYQYEGIFLTMSANTDMYKQARQSVLDTWAKDLIEGKYPGYTFYCYTSCNDEHPVPCIDGHMIYVNCPDDLRHTYTKTKKAFEMLRDNRITYKQVYRTNTSVYINVPSIIKEVQHEENTMSGYLAGYYLKDADGSYAHQFNFIAGLYIGMSYDVVSKIFFNPLDETIGTPIIEGDDITIHKIIRYLGLTPNIIGPNPNFEHDYIRYKCCTPEDYNEFEDWFSLDKKYKDDPYESLRFNNVIQLRSCYNNEERITKGHEIEHMYELHEAFKQIKGEF
jgi:hypothetical protein